MRFAPVLLALLPFASCASANYHTETAQVANQTRSASLQTHVQKLTSLGPRRAGDAEKCEQTVNYLEAELHSLNISTQREIFSAPVDGQLELILEDLTMELPEVYFFDCIRQASVRDGIANSYHMLSKVKSYGLKRVDAVDVPQTNLLATIPGTRFPELVLEISAHYDTVPGTVGADDNTSGVAVLLEVARLLKEQAPACTVRLCFFAAEEPGLLGSKYHMEQLIAQGEIDALIGLLNMDGVGYYTEEENSQQAPPGAPFFLAPPTTGNFLAMIGDATSADLAHLVEKNAQQYVPELPLFVLARLGGMLPDTRRSDHAPYWDADIPAVLLTDTANFRNPHYHCFSDEATTLDFHRLRQVASVVVAAALAATEQAAVNQASR